MSRLQSDVGQPLQSDRGSLVSAKRQAWVRPRSCQQYDTVNTRYRLRDEPVLAGEEWLTRRSSIRVLTRFSGTRDTDRGPHGDPVQIESNAEC